MKNLLYIGNKLSNKGKTASTIDTLGKGLQEVGFNVSYASSFQNIVLRMVDMLWTVFKHRKSVDYVLIDTYSTLNFYYAFAVSKLCKLLKLKYIPILHGGNLPERVIKSPKLSASIFKNAFVNVSPSSYIKSKFEAVGYSNIKVIPNSITIDNYLFKQRKIDKVKLLWVRSFSALYNPNLAIDVLFQLKQKGIEATLCMIGPDNDGSLKIAKNYAESLKVDVTFTGKLSKTDWIALATDYNIFINTTNFDNTPVSVMEAMALGLPVISTNVGGIPFLVEDEKDGLLVEPNNSDAFVNNIIRLTEDSNLIETLTKSARLKAETLDWQIVKNLWTSTLV